ncbi:MAG TPA: prenyltransferase/squalene oxidase repeat-containing protein [bacterium]|nr:prenyltransferase/squalene oxidase repeat-containing protein [bacterium]
MEPRQRRITPRRALFPSAAAVLLLLAASFAPPPAPAGEAELPAPVESGISFLLSRQREDGAIAAAESRKFDVWETVEALTAIASWKTNAYLASAPPVRKALDFLRFWEDGGGMLLHRSGRRGEYCLETSAEYCRLLGRLESRGIGVSESADRVAQRIRGLQPPAGGWDLGNSAVPRGRRNYPSVTGFALRALADRGLSPLRSRAALEFLSRTFREEGNWGSDPYYYGTPFYALAPILSALGSRPGGAEVDALRDRARNFIFSVQTPDGGFSFASVRDPSGPSEQLETALALRALLGSGLDSRDPRIRRALSWLLNRQEADGSWAGGRFPAPGGSRLKREDVYCTAQVLQVLADCPGAVP